MLSKNQTILSDKKFTLNNYSKRIAKYCLLLKSVPNGAVCDQVHYY